MRKGEIWLVGLPYWNGKEQGGNRPAVVLADTNEGLLIVIPLTSNLQTLKHSKTLEIKPSEKNCLDTSSVALIFQIRSLDKRRLIHKIGNLEENYIRQIDETIKDLFKL